MTFDLLALALSVWLGGSGPGDASGPLSTFGDVTFRPRERAVSNWRLEAAAHLDASMGFAANVLLGRDPSRVSRCVRLNNYWCIKRAGWAGEIASDADGHVAFASAAEGADVAALLLRRYYVDYRRRSALAIISRWAPAACDAPSPGRLPARTGSSGARSAADRLTTRGIGSTLRAQFLARGRRSPGGARRALRRSVVPDRLIGHALPAPTVAFGLDDRALGPPGDRLGTWPFGGLGLPAAPHRSVDAGLSCLADGARVQTYAARAAAGVAASAADDLHLFDAAGRPTPNLARVMHNMSAVEIGPLGATDALIASAVRRADEIAVRRAAELAAQQTLHGSITVPADPVPSEPRRGRSAPQAAR